MSWIYPFLRPNVYTEILLKRMKLHKTLHLIVPTIVSARRVSRSFLLVILIKILHETSMWLSKVQKHAINRLVTMHGKIHDITVLG